jgi:hypothetical protein
MINNLHTATRSALLAKCEATGELGIRPVERDQLNRAPQLSDYRMHFFKDARIEAYQQTPETPITVEALAKAIVFDGDPFGVGWPVSIDIIAEIDGAVRFIGFVGGDAVWIETSEVANGWYVLKVRNGQDTTVFHFDPEFGSYQPASGAVATTARAMDVRGRLVSPRAAA